MRLPASCTSEVNVSYSQYIYIVMRVTPDTLLFELLRAKNDANAASTTFKPIVQYYYVVLCEFESERKWILEAVPTTCQK